MQKELPSHQKPNETKLQHGKWEAERTATVTHRVKGTLITSCEAERHIKKDI